MNKIFAPFLPPWAETGLQPAFYDVESGTVLQQTARMYNKVNQLIRLFNEFSEATSEEVNAFEREVNETVAEYIEKFTDLKDYVEDYFENLDVQEEINNKLDAMVEDGTFDELLNDYLVIFGGNAKALGCKGDGVTDDTSAINTAISDLVTAGVYELVFPKGEYVISGQINIPSNFELRGMQGSVLKYVGNGISGNLLNIQGTDADNPVENVSITNISIDGTNQVYKGGHDMDNPTVTSTDPMYYGLVCVCVKYGKNIKITGCNFNDVYGEGIKLLRCTNCIVEECNLKDVSSGNITPSGQTGYDNHGDGIVAFYSFNIKFLNNTVVNTRLYQAGLTGAIGKPCGRSGLEYEYPINLDYEDNDPDDVEYNAPDYSLISTTTITDKDYRLEYGNIMEGNFVYGYTKGVHIETLVKCQVVNNTILSNHIGIMYSTEAGGIIEGNYINPFGIGQAPQSGYNLYYSGIAISQFGVTARRYGIIVTNNTIEGEGKGVILGCNGVNVNSNQFLCDSGVYTALENLQDCIISNNTFKQNFTESSSPRLYLYHVKSAVVDKNIFYSEGGNTLEISGDNIQFTNNVLTNISIYHPYGGKNLYIATNTFNGMHTTRTWVLNLNAINASTVENNTFNLNDASYDSKKVIRIEGTPKNSSILKNNFYLSANHDNTQIIHIESCEDLNLSYNKCYGANDNTRFIVFYNGKRLTLIGNVNENANGEVIRCTGSFQQWTVEENNMGKVYAGGYYPNDSLGRFVDAYFNKSDRFYKYNINGSSVNMGWICTGAGFYVTDTWTSDTTYAANKMIKNTSSNVYKCITAGAGASTVEPTQTTGTQAESDGYTWKYLGAVATFKDLAI